MIVSAAGCSTLNVRGFLEIELEVVCQGFCGVYTVAGIVVMEGLMACTDWCDGRNERS